MHPLSVLVAADAVADTTTGISAHDRALTARALASSSTASDFSRPGHMVPLRARAGGVLARRGHTEAALDFCVAADLPRAGLLCELVNDDAQGSMARRDDCRAFADRWGVRMVSIDMLVEWRRRTERVDGAHAP
jgi:3,4-dihydroxy-2-butanone 4-phosphate synthase